MFPSPLSFLSYRVLTDEGREALECTHVEHCCYVDVLEELKFWPGSKVLRDFFGGVVPDDK